MRAPEAPMGWPSATAPPCTFTRSGESPSSRVTATACTASSAVPTTCRGGVVNEAALYEALKKQRIAGAGVDVWDPEPVQPNNPLLEFDNVIATPHSAFYSEYSNTLIKQRVGLAIEGERLGFHVHLSILAAEGAQFFCLALELGEAFFEVEIGRHSTLRGLSVGISPSAARLQPPPRDGPGAQHRRRRALRSVT